MAHIFRRPGSRFFWIKYRDPGSGEVVRESTGWDEETPDVKQKLKRLRAEKHAKEMSAPRTNERERWEKWAYPYFEDRYRLKPGSLKNAKKALVDLMMFFQEKEIRTPRQVTYDIAAAFVPWRIAKRFRKRKEVDASAPTKPKKRKGDPKTGVSRNTGRLRFAYFRVLMSEAVRRGFTDNNPCREVELQRDPAKEKNEITADDQAKIESELATKPQWMREQWMVLMRQGCRVAETAVPLERINTDEMTITFKLKGGRLHTASLHKQLLPLVERARAEGRTCLIEGPPSSSWPAIWSDFFTRRDLPYSIHCTRVTVITRMVRKGSSVTDVCNLIGHTEAVNKIYRKLKPKDSASLLDILDGASIL
jgi:site-specific recombinase XerD